MKAFSYWINSILAGIMAFVGLLASSRAADDAFAVGGLIVFLGCVLFIFSAIGRHFDRLGSAH
ncbi:hypothetical protein VY88_10720 [Azospirillum thiophilum]|uniref:Uncharacterized protein n=1 Tax=Azospirillum thiophilum TaxID=528244 RepID=A0AAC9EWZ3_9PROT|nr:hypothetical protein [Azospirillum thiophilum]ALG69896.1 hypothetical protein AL072_01990 [Azospirillum thiophilum]KJR66418.1 hypothetical protein VY88_10720 [Azospirillum thiophilum]